MTSDRPAGRTEEADRRIDEVIEYHRQRKSASGGSRACTTPHPTWASVCEGHGLVWAGDNLTMVRLGLENPAIPINPAAEIAPLGETTDADTEAALQVSGRGVSIGPVSRPTSGAVGWFEQVKGTPTLPGTTCSTWPGSRASLWQHRAHRAEERHRLPGRRLEPCRSIETGSSNSTLLRRAACRRLAALGYQVAMTYDGPMSRRVLVKYGFEAYNKFDIYAWMPVIDMAVIKGLIVDE